MATTSKPQTIVARVRIETDEERDQRQKAEGELYGRNRPRFVAPASAVVSVAYAEVEASPPTHAEVTEFVRNRVKAIVSACQRDENVTGLDGLDELRFLRVGFAADGMGRVHGERLSVIESARVTLTEIADEEARYAAERAEYERQRKANKSKR